MRGRLLRLAMGVLAAALAIAMAVTIVGCSSSSTTSQSSTVSAEPIKVGAIVSLTGNYASLGQAEKNAIDMEVKKINAAGGINGHKLEVVIADDGTDEAKAVAAATKLIEQDKVVAIIGGTGTGQSMAVRTVIDRAGVPQVSMAGGNAITGNFDPLVFQTAWTNGLVAPYELAAMKQAGINKIGVLSDSGGFGKDGRAILATEAAKAGITVVSDQTFNPGDADMSAQLTNIKKAGADAVVIWTAGGDAATIAKNAKALNLGLPLWGSHGNARIEFIKGAGDAAEGFTFAAGHVLVPSTYGTGTPSFETATKFVDEYTAAYGAAPSTFAGHAFDALYLVANAAKTLGDKITPPTLRDAIEKTKDFAGIGGTFTFSSTDHNGLSDKDLTLYKVQNGTWVVAQ
jgi:branched-chain amino acid transport system substrate-binding protein